MPRLMIDGHSVVVNEGTTLLEAAAGMGIRIPTLCHLQGSEPFTSCMICAVKDTASGRLLPACSAPATDGMVVETHSEEVRRHRKQVLELMMGEHAGDCEAPCRVTCPARMDIPLMLRQIAAGDLPGALATARAAIAMPGVVGHVCVAPCEKACRRGRHDAPVSICLMERIADAQAGIEPALVRGKSSGKRVAVIGAGPAGLASAYYLALAGHACTIFDDHEEPGGQLRYRTSNAILPFAALDREVAVIRQLGVEFQMKTRIEPSIGLERLKATFDAVVLTPGKFATQSLAVWGLASDDRGFKVEGATLRSSDPKVFAGGEAVHPGRMAVRAMAHGRLMACAIDQWVSGASVTGEPGLFNSRLGRLHEEELAELVKEAVPAGRMSQPVTMDSTISSDAAGTESRRCLHCDCRCSKDCRLRDIAGEYEVDHSHITMEGRLEFSMNTTHPEIVFEPGKCIKCGICVRIATTAKEGTGLAFIGRGYGTVVGVPFNDSLVTALGEKAGECVRDCPTGALAWKIS